MSQILSYDSVSEPLKDDNPLDTKINHLRENNTWIYMSHL